MMHTHYFPALRSRLAALGTRTVPSSQHFSLPQLEGCLATYLPIFLLSATDCQRRRESGGKAAV